MSVPLDQDGEDKNPMGPPQLSENLSDEVATMWEIPQMYQFLCLTKETLGIQHLSMYEMERMLLMPKASKQLGTIMTYLLCPPMPKSKLRTIPSMPYQFWTNLLTHRALGWFKLYQMNSGDTVQVFESIGVEPEFWKIFPEPELISDRKFEKLNLRERIWLLKTICDTLIHTRRTLHDEIVRNYLDDDSEMVLGRDRHGARYIHFPIFLDNDLRVYRHCLDNKILLSFKAPRREAKPKVEPPIEKKKVKRKRTAWRYGKLPTKAKKKVKSDKDRVVDQGNKVSKQVSGANEMKNPSDGQKPTVSQDKSEIVGNEATQVPNSEIAETSKDDNQEERSEEQDSQALRDDVSNCSKTDDEKISEKRMSPVLSKDVEKSKSDDEKIIEAKSPIEALSNAEKDEPENVMADADKLSGERISEATDNVDDRNTQDAESKTGGTATRAEIEKFKCMITDLGESSFRLVADSIDALRDLVACFRAQNYPEGPGTMACEVQLIKKLTALITKLERIELTLNQSKSDAKEKLQREWTDFHEAVKKRGTRPADDEVGSNAWIIGSQGCPVLANGDVPSQSSLETHSPPPPPIVEGGVKIKLEKKDEDEEKSNESDGNTRRVLRARGISSYVEPFFTSSEDSTHSELDTVLSHEPPLATGEVSPPDPLPIRLRLAGEASGAYDSDQDWILPKNRKRKRKRSTAKHPKSREKLVKMNSGSTTLHPASDPISHDSNPRTNPLSTPTPPTNSPPRPPSHPSISIRPVLQSTSIPPPLHQNTIKITSVHSELDIKDEPAIMDNVTSTSGASDNSLTNGVQNYVLVNAGNGPVNYVVMPQDNINNNSQQQSGPMVSVAPPPPPPQSYLPNLHGMQSYMPSSGGYIVPHVGQYRQPYPGQSMPPMMMPGQMMQGGNYVHMGQPNYPPYHQNVMPGYPAMQGPGVTQSMAGVRPPNRDIQIRAVGQGQARPQGHPMGVVVRSSMPGRGAPRHPMGPRGIPFNRGRGVRPNMVGRGNMGQARPSINRNIPATNAQNKTTSLIVLSDSDDEIEMIITEKSGSSGKKGQQRAQSKKPVVTSEVAVASKSVLSPQIIQRMHQGGISITPIKPKSPEKSTIAGGTQLVVVVNETGSHYALALPNGSKLILTPEQVAQIRASNGGKLIL